MHSLMGPLIILVYVPITCIYPIAENLVRCLIWQFSKLYFKLTKFKPCQFMQSYDEHSDQQI